MATQRVSLLIIIDKRSTRFKVQGSRFKVQENPLTFNLEPCSCRQGFTLLELLVALALLVIVAAAIYGSYFTVLRGRDSATAGMESLRESAATLAQLRREISSALYKSGDKKLFFVVEDRDQFGKPASNLTFSTLEMTRTGDIPSSDLREVSYRTREKEGKLLLTRSEKELFFEYEAQEYPQMEELEGFLVECNDNGKWVRSWDTALNGKLPDAVRITLTVKDGDKTLPYRAVIRPRIRQ